MKIKNLTNIILSSSLALSEFGCITPDNMEYHFSGKIGEDHVIFEEPFNVNILKVKKGDGALITYVDRDNDFLLDNVEIKVEENTTKYFKNSKNPYVQRVMKISQENFDHYLKEIMKIQTAPLNSRKI